MNRARPFTLTGLLLLCCEHAGITWADAVGKGRSKAEQAARVAFAIAATRWGWSLPEIAAAELRASHTSVINRLHKYEAGAIDSPEVVELAESIVRQLPQKPAPRLHPQLDGDIRLQRKLLNSLGMLPRTTERTPNDRPSPRPQPQPARRPGAAEDRRQPEPIAAANPGRGSRCLPGPRRRPQCA